MALKERIGTVVSDKMDKTVVGLFTTVHPVAMYPCFSVDFSPLLTAVHPVAVYSCPSAEFSSRITWWLCTPARLLIFHLGSPGGFIPLFIC